MSSSQVCRPHFHAPLHPWLADGAKPLGHSAAGPWVPFGSAAAAQAAAVAAGGDADKSQSPAQGGQPHNIFSFPPTPPKDSTPDSVAPPAGPDYHSSAVAAAMGAFMQDQGGPQSCALDVKPGTNNNGGGGGGGGGGAKQREGSDYEGGGHSAGMFNGNFDGTYGPAAYGHGIHGGGGATTGLPGGGYSPSAAHKQNLAQVTTVGGHANAAHHQSPNKPRNKSRTSAGKRRSINERN
nr:unnamed protein product [Callosobruchus analis]